MMIEIPMKIQNLKNLFPHCAHLEQLKLHSRKYHIIDSSATPIGRVLFTCFGNSDNSPRKNANGVQRYMYFQGLFKLRDET